MNTDNHVNHAPAPLLRYEDFSISFGSGRREKFAVSHLDLEIGVGERVALVGESGSGKTLTALAPLRLEPEGAKTSGRILWSGKNAHLGKPSVNLLVFGDMNFYQPASESGFWGVIRR